MKLTDETIKRIRHNKYSVDCIQGMCTLSDGDIIANLCDTIEALRQDNADWQKRYEELDAGHSKLYKDFCEVKQENERLKQQLIDAMRDYRNPADVEALKVAREVLRALNQADWCDCDHCKGVREAIAAIDKIGGEEDV